jgi:hypothetical protein
MRTIASVRSAEQASGEGQQWVESLKLLTEVAAS